MTPRVFVGTMHYQEGDFQSCLRSVHAQKEIKLTHFLISGLGEAEAHRELWAAWRTARGSHDMFVKVDADTELAHDHVLSAFWSRMSLNERITGIQAPLHDHFTNDNINGLNCFSPRVIFRDSDDPLFVDRVDTNHDVVVASWQVGPLLTPAGFHCRAATDVQAFHYGLHRALKGQQHVINRVNIEWTKSGDRKRAMVLLGAKAAPSFVDKSGFNYPDARFKAAFQTAVNEFDEATRQLERKFA